MFAIKSIFFNFRLGFGPRDTRWVGAWWMGFGFTAVAFVFVSIPLFGYPKYMPGKYLRFDLRFHLCMLGIIVVSKIQFSKHFIRNTI